jgi:hypothetical protein
MLQGPFIFIIMKIQDKEALKGLGHVNQLMASRPLVSKQRLTITMPV